MSGLNIKFKEYGGRGRDETSQDESRRVRTSPDELRTSPDELIRVQTKLDQNRPDQNRTEQKRTIEQSRPDQTRRDVM